MGRPKLSDEEKLRRAAERKVLKKIKQQEEFEQARIAKQESSLSILDDSNKKAFLEVIDFIASPESKNHRLSEMATSIYSQWKTWGNLSEKQIFALIKWYVSFQETLDVAETINDFYEIGKNYNFKNVNVLCKDPEVESNRFNNSVNFVYRIVLKNSRTKISHMIKTSSEKLYQKFLELNGKSISVNAKIKWIVPDSSIIILTSNGIKFL
jgi:hypothetical protein